MKKKFSSGMNVGSSSILVTFVLLCLVTFAALSFLSANSDYRLSKQAAARTTAFYDANRMAEIYMANIEALLAKQNSSNSDEASYMDSIQDIFSDNDSITVDTTTTPYTLHYSVKVNNTQNLEVTLSVNYPDADDSALFHIQKWQTVTNETWQQEADKSNGSGGETGLMIFD